MTTTSLGEDLGLLRDAAVEAGRLAMAFFRRNPATWAKDGGSPVTEADMAVDGFLHRTLLERRPDYGWLSEETADNPARRERRTIFVVDPIDGTRGFIEGDDRWCVSVAVVRDRRPVAAVLNAPARGELYTAVAGGGAWIEGRRLAVSTVAALEGTRLAGPRGWLKSLTLRRTGAVLQSHVPSLAYRFASVATGGFDAAFASPRAQDWDLAACDLLVHEAGGRLTGLDGEAPNYNGEDPRHGVLAAANVTLLPALVAVLEQVAGERARTAPPSRPTPS